MCTCNLQKGSVMKPFVLIEFLLESFKANKNCANPSIRHHCQNAYLPSVSSVVTLERSKHTGEKTPATAPTSEESCLHCLLK